MSRHSYTKKDESDMKYLMFIIVALAVTACASGPDLSGCKEECIKNRCGAYLSPRGDYTWDYCYPTCDKECNEAKY